MFRALMNAHPTNAIMGASPMPSTRDVLDHHLQCFGAGDLEGTLADYAADAALLTPEGALRGVPAIREIGRAHV